MVGKIISFFLSWFIYSHISWTLLLTGIGLALAFGAIWFIPYWTPILKKPWAWAVLIGSALLSLIAVSFIQLPLQYWSSLLLLRFWSSDVLMHWLPLSGIPQTLFSGLVQEGSKLVPVIIFWWRKGRHIDPRQGLILGAVAGAGLGIFEAVWAHNTVLTSGWSWAAVQTMGLVALAPFWERFFVIGFHIASCAIAGWGLAKGWGWQFYLLASFLHAFINYSAILLTARIMTTMQLEAYAAVWAILVTGGALSLRWRKQEDITAG